MSGYSDPGFDTLALHAGAAPDPATGARAVPIHLTTSFVFESSEHAASLFNLERAGHVYSRISNPTNAVLEQRVSALEGGIGAISTASGQAALHLCVATLMGAGSHIVASTALYGGTIGTTTVRTAMDDAPLTCTTATELDEVRRMMLERHARYMPVMDQSMLMGVISFYDVAKAVVDSQNFENKMLKAYIRDWPEDGSALATP